MFQIDFQHGALHAEGERLAPEGQDCSHPRHQRREVQRPQLLHDERAILLERSVHERELVSSLNVPNPASFCLF